MWRAVSQARPTRWWPAGAYPVPLGRWWPAGAYPALKKSVAAKVINELADIATSEVKKAGVFTVPGLCRIKTRMKPATKAGKREMFGKITVVKAKPAKKIVKAFPVAALKASI